MRAVLVIRVLNSWGESVKEIENVQTNIGRSNVRERKIGQEREIKQG